MNTQIHPPINSQTIEQNHHRYQWVYTPDPARSCFVGGFSIQSNQSNFEKFLRQNYQSFFIESVHLVEDRARPGYNKGFGFVTLELREQLPAFLRLSLVFEGKPLKIDRALGYEDKNRNITKNSIGNRVKLTGLSPIHKEKDLTEFLSQKKLQVSRCLIFTDHSLGEIIAVLDFKNAIDAKRCRKLKKLKIKNKELKICLESKKEQKTRQNKLEDVETNSEDEIWIKKAANASNKLLDDNLVNFEQKDDKGKIWYFLKASEDKLLNDSWHNYGFCLANKKDLNLERKYQKIETRVNQIRMSMKKGDLLLRSLRII